MIVKFLLLFKKQRMSDQVHCHIAYCPIIDSAGGIKAVASDSLHQRSHMHARARERERERERERKRGKEREGKENKKQREYRLLDSKAKVSKEGVVHDHFKQQISLEAVQ